MTLSFASLLSILLYSLTVNADMALAKMQATYPHKLEDIVKQANMAKTNLAQGNNLVDWATLADEGFDIDTVYALTNNPALVDAHDIINQIRKELRNPVKWKEKLSSVSIQKLTKKKELLRNNLGEKNIEWAWVLNQIGEKNKAKEILKNIFAEEYKETMALTQAVFGMGRSPLANLQGAFAALESMSSAKEMAEYQEKMQKAKIHISGLPQSHIMT